MAHPHTIIYVDGFNLYYGALRNTPYKWLDLGTLFRNLLPSNEIVKIRYFTALVSGRPHDLDIPNRQKIYLRALRTIPNLEIKLGHYLSSVKSMPLATPPATGSPTVKVIRTEEKGTDVNIASYILWDAFQDRYDIAAIVSNDSDLEEPIRIVTEKMKKCVGIINPQRYNPLAAKLAQVAQFRRRIGDGLLQISQFPPTITDEKGTFHKPPSW